MNLFLFEPVFDPELDSTEAHRSQTEGSLRAEGEFRASSFEFQAFMPPALILLAAGGSTRMGKTKQLLPYRGVTLLRHAASIALSSRCGPVAVVIGSQAAQMRRELDGLPVRIASNPAWANGMGGSIRVGLSMLLADARPPAVVIMLCDQPAVSADTLNRLVDRHESNRAPIVASAYDGIVGVPALFDGTMFEELLQLDDAGGARQVIRRHAEGVEAISFPAGSLDVDTPQDYERLK